MLKCGSKNLGNVYGTTKGRKKEREKERVKERERKIQISNGRLELANQAHVKSQQCQKPT